MRKSNPFSGIRRDLRYFLEVVGIMINPFRYFIRVICLRERAERAAALSGSGLIHDVVIDIEIDIL